MTRMAGLKLFQEEFPVKTQYRQLHTKAARSEWLASKDIQNDLLESISRMSTTITENGRPFSQSMLYQAYQHQPLAFEETNSFFILERPGITLTTKEELPLEEETPCRFFLDYEDEKQATHFSFSLTHTNLYALDLTFLNNSDGSEYFKYTSGSDFQPLDQMTTEEATITKHYLSQCDQRLKEEDSYL